MYSKKKKKIVPENLTKYHYEFKFDVLKYFHKG
jgi:hypothetical protein